ncbi:MAG: hypothetical protein BWZ10_03356 [candidate division BRC1 bacterium ADurb.BinA364]|nr:MAG: hypothetical protein BWZ10_03356 [candidate division BRC1 bacterium ADurb.BinA364]
MIWRTCSPIADLSESRAFSSASTEPASFVNVSCAGASTSFTPVADACLCFSNVSLASAMKLCRLASSAWVARPTKCCSSFLACSSAAAARAAAPAFSAANSAAIRLASARSVSHSATARSRSARIMSTPSKRAFAAAADS